MKQEGATYLTLTFQWFQQGRQACFRGDVKKQERHTGTNYTSVLISQVQNEVYASNKNWDKL
jgi:pyridoxine/pyridoxamine 5'-phosphate oxidase